MLFQLAHANENEDGVGYTIKHVFVMCSSLHRVHVYVELFGFLISPECYDNYDENFEPAEQQVQDCLQKYSVKEWERINEECSLGEHYWHALKPVDYDGLPIELGGHNIFKLSIEFNLPCEYQYTNDKEKWSPYTNEINTYIYQFKANSSTDVLEYIRHNSHVFHLEDYFHKMPDELSWEYMSNICKEDVYCKGSNHVHGKFIRMNCEELQSLIRIFNSNM